MNDSQQKPADKHIRFRQLKRLAIFQIKLMLDALRDILLSPLSLLLTLFDLIEGKYGPQSHFEKLLRFGKKTERRINLFNQHDDDPDRVHTVDSIVTQVEDILKREYQDGEYSSKAKLVLDKTMSRIKNNSKPNQP